MLNDGYQTEKEIGETRIRIYGTERTVFIVEKTQYQFKERVKTQAYQYLRLLREFFNSYIFYVLETLLACAFVLFRQEVFGVIVFIGLLAILLVVCEDVLPTTLPFLLVCAFSTNCYDSFDTFIGYAIYAPVVVP